MVLATGKLYLRFLAEAERLLGGEGFWGLGLGLAVVDLGLGLDLDLGGVGFLFWLEGGESVYSSSEEEEESSSTSSGSGEGMGLPGGEGVKGSELMISRGFFLTGRGVDVGAGERPT